LISTDESEQILMLENLENDNINRLECKNSAIENITRKISNTNIEEKNILIVYEKNINEGVLGIIASNIASKYNKPTIILTESSEDGILKGSGRSIEPLNIFTLINKYRNMFVSLGGHAQACGLSIKKENLKELEEKLLFATKDICYNDRTNLDIINLDESEINLSMALMVQALEPFGHKNNKVEFTTNIFVQSVKQIKSYPHYTFTSKNNTEFIGFYCNDYLPLLSSGKELKLIYNLDINSYKFLKPQSIVSVIELCNNDTIISEDYLSQSLWFLYNSMHYTANINVKLADFADFKFNKYQSIALNPNINDLHYDEIPIKYFPSNNLSSTISSKIELELSDLIGYNKIYLFNGFYFENGYNFLKGNVQVFAKQKSIITKDILTDDRSLFAKVYKIIKSNITLLNTCFSIYDAVKKIIQQDPTISACQAMFCMLTFADLKFIIIDTTTGFNIKENKTEIKKSLTDSLFYKCVLLNIKD
ncbi:MAG: DHHA1 domain-containing protein, partial [Clostridia bacterium]